MTVTVKLIFGYLFFIGWFAMAASYIYFRLRVQPRALQGWAEGHGLDIVARAYPNIFHVLDKRFSGRISNCQGYWWLTLRDHKGQLYRCWATVGRYWRIPLSPGACPIEVEWDGPAPDLAKLKEVAKPVHPLRDRDLDG